MREYTLTGYQNSGTFNKYPNVVWYIRKGKNHYKILKILFAADLLNNMYLFTVVGRLKE